MHQAGFTNAVATLGTALTEEQSRLIAQYTGEVVLSYDSDGPGQKATRRATDLLEAAGVKIRVLSIPDAKDPDEYIKNSGRNGLPCSSRGAAPPPTLRSITCGGKTTLPPPRARFRSSSSLRC